MKIEVVQTFYGRPDEAAEENTIFLEGAIIDVPDDFAHMVIKKDLAKIVHAKHPARKEPIHEAE